jgi:predicted dehydrogenase
VNIAIVGYGLAGRVFHGPLIAATPGMRVGAIVTASPQRQAEARRDFPEALVLAQSQDVWDAAHRFDLAVIATASGSHAQVAAAAIDAGVAVVVEKPMATSAAAAKSLTEYAAARGVLLIPFLNRRWDSDHLTLGRLLAEGRLGTVLRYESRFERWRPTPGSGWRDSRAPEMGGGLLLDLGSHLIDQALTLFGPVSAVYAEVLGRRGGADDDVFLALHHESGVLSHLWAGALAAAPGPRLRVLGDRGAYVITQLDGQEDALRAGRRPDQPAFADPSPDRWGRLLHGDDGEPVPTVPGRWSEFYAGVRNALCDAAPPPVTAAEAIAGLAIIDAARESARRQVLVVPIRADE